MGAFVYSHSGEFSAVARDLRIPGFALDLELVRSYRSSLAGRTAALARGWTCNLARRVERTRDHGIDGGIDRFDTSDAAVHQFDRRQLLGADQRARVDRVEITRLGQGVS